MSLCAAPAKITATTTTKANRALHSLAHQNLVGDAFPVWIRFFPRRTFHRRLLGFREREVGSIWRQSMLVVFFFSGQNCNFPVIRLDFSIFLSFSRRVLECLGFGGLEMNLRCMYMIPAKNRINNKPRAFFFFFFLLRCQLHLHQNGTRDRYQV